MTSAPGTMRGLQILLSLALLEAGLDDGVRSVRARIDGTVLSGTLRFAGNSAAVTGRRR